MGEPISDTGGHGANHLAPTPDSGQKRRSTTAWHNFLADSTHSSLRARTDLSALVTEEVEDACMEAYRRIAAFGFKRWNGDQAATDGYGLSCIEQCRVAIHSPQQRGLASRRVGLNQRLEVRHASALRARTGQTPDQRVFDRSHRSRAAFPDA
jgi:hypothetical protein